MAGLKSRIAVLACSVAGAALASEAQAPGRSLYLHGTGNDPVIVRIGDPPTQVHANAYACARCHGADGLGGSEGGVAAPSLAGRHTPASLEAALTQGRGNDGRALLPAMPRYTLTPRDLAALSAYIGRLPYAAQPGLDARTIRISLDLSGSAFDMQEQAQLRAWLQAALERSNGDGGLYGRAIALVSDDDALFGLAWVSDPSRRLPHIAVRAHPDPKQPACSTCCATVHADLSTQVDWLRAHLQRQGIHAALHGPMSSDFGLGSTPKAGPREAIVYLGNPTDLPASARGIPVYVFADLGTPPASHADVRVVSPLDLRAQMAAVEQAQRNEAGLRSNPRIASAAVELHKALDLLIQALTSEGRRIRVPELCARLQAQTIQQQRISVFRLSDGAILASSADKD